jgi:hypothetical protein
MTDRTSIESDPSTTDVKPYGQNWTLNPNLPTTTFLLHPSTTWKPLQAETYTVRTTTERQEAMKLGKEKVDEAKKYAAHQYDRIFADWVQLEAAAGISQLSQTVHSTGILTTLRREIQIDPSTGPREPKRILGHSRWMTFLLSHFPKYKFPKFSLAEARSRNKAVKEHSPPIPTHTNITGPCILLDADDEIIGVLVINGASLLLSGIQDYTPPENPVAVAAIENMGRYLRPVPAENDYRYVHNEHRQAEKDFHAAHPEILFGTLHLGLWFMLGHESESTSLGLGLFNQIPTYETCGGRPGAMKKRFEAATQFLDDIMEPVIACAAVFKATFPQKYEEAKSHQQQFVEGLGQTLNQYSELECQNMVVVVANVAVSNHKDPGDSKSSVTTEMARDMCLPQLDVRLEIEDSDLFVLMANTVEHGLTEIIGDRYAVISTTKSDNNTPHNVAFEGDPTRVAHSHLSRDRREMKKGKGHALRQQKEKELIRAYRNTSDFDKNGKSSMDYHKLRQVITLHHKLCAPTRVKRKFIKEFKSAQVYDWKSLKDLSAAQHPSFFR